VGDTTKRIEIKDPDGSPFRTSGYSQEHDFQAAYTQCYSAELQPYCSGKPQFSWVREK
jgi:hypothetical protein